MPPEASLVDYGDGEGGLRYIELHTTGEASTVASDLERSWLEAGWERRGGRFQRGHESAAFKVEALSPTLTRVEIDWKGAP